MNADTRVDWRVREALAIIELMGDFTDAVEADFRAAYDAICEADRQHILLHFQREGDILSSGIALLIGLLQDTERRGQQCYAAGLSEHFAEVFDLTGLTQYIQLVSSEQCLLDSLSTEV